MRPCRFHSMGPSCWINLQRMELIRETQSDFMGFFFPSLLCSWSAMTLVKNLRSAVGSWPVQTCFLLFWVPTKSPVVVVTLYLKEILASNVFHPFLSIFWPLPPLYYFKINNRSGDYLLCIPLQWKPSPPSPVNNSTSAHTETSNNIHMHAQTHRPPFPLTEGQFSHVHFLSVQFASHRKRSTPRSEQPLQPPRSDALTVWGWKPIRLFSSTHERIPVKVSTEENGHCPLIYRLSQEEEGLLMHLELTSCVQRPISLLVLALHIILLLSVSHVSLCPFNISAVLIFFFFA